MRQKTSIIDSVDAVNMARTKKEPKVTVFGRVVDEERLKKDHRGDNLVFGVLMVFTGTLLLLNSLGIIPWEVWEQLWRFWPVLLVLGGIQIILGGSGPARLIVFLLSVYTIGSLFLFVMRSQMPDKFNTLPQELKNTIYVWEVIAK